jgi:hypothetical protein
MTHTTFRLNKRWTIEPAGRRWCLTRRPHPGAVPDFSLYADRPQDLAAAAEQHCGPVNAKVLAQVRRGHDNAPDHGQRCFPIRPRAIPAASTDRFR